MSEPTEAERLRMLVEDSTDVLWEVDAQGIYTYLSPNTERILGYAREELIGKSPFEFMPPEDALRVGEAFAAIVADRRPFALLAHGFRFKDGRVGWLECSGRPILSPDGRLLGYRGIDRDITERKWSEIALADSKALLESLFDNLDVVFFSVRFPGPEVLQVSKACERVYGLPREAFLADPWLWRKVVLPEDLPLIQRGFETVQSGHGIEHAYRIRHSSGEVRWLEVKIRPTLDAAGSLVLLDGFVTDVSQRKRADEARERAEEQLRHTQKLESLGRLAGGVAHDFNNLLGIIQGCADFLTREVPADGQAGRDADEIIQACRRGADLVRQLQAFSRREPCRLGPVALEAVLEDMSALLRRSLGEHVELEVECQDHLPTILADANRIEQVVLNLAINARDAMPRGGRLRIRAALAGEDESAVARKGPAADSSFVRLTVSDTGEGMTAEVLERAFDPFFTTKDVDRGTGLGLSIVHGIVTEAGGRVRIRSTPGEGTTVEVDFRTASGSALPPSMPVRPASARNVGAGRTILVVEDNDAMRRVAMRQLEARSFRVLEAAGGEEALGVFAKPEPIDLLLSDVVMPRMSGPELARRARTLRPELPVVLMSGYADSFLPASDEGPPLPVVWKPFREDDLLEAVRKALHDRSCARSS